MTGLLVVLGVIVGGAALTLLYLVLRLIFDETLFKD